MDTKGPITPPSYVHAIVDDFVVTVLIKQYVAQTAVNSLLHHWITKFEPPVYIVTTLSQNTKMQNFLCNSLYCNGN